MMKIALIVLAYNESNTIEKIIVDNYNLFEKTIVINDKSKDNTSEILQKLDNKYENLIIINNSKNLGAGKSFEIGLKKFTQTDCDYAIKIDGDDQFSMDDIIKLKEILQNDEYEFIKCDRFWLKGINGKIPIIRYFGNAFASFLIKFATGNWKINDALNGLFGISKSLASVFELPRLFNRYGYPFYLNTFVFNFSITNPIKIGQYKNTITYGEEKSSLNPLTMFFKLIYFVVLNFFKKIKIKIQVSELQISSILDIVSLFIFSNLVFSIYKFIGVRYFETPGPQGTWYLLVIIFLILYLSVLTLSQKQESAFNKSYFSDIG
jgi:glycosyltransferase involved in cell wall biosynthesis